MSKAERRGRLKRNDAKPSPLVKREDAANLIEITNHPFDPVLLQSTSLLRAGLAEPAPRPDQQVMCQSPQKHEQALRLEPLFIAFRDAQTAFV